MSLRINTNVEATNAYRQLNKTSSELSKSMEKLSSGLRINRAADDAAGLGISEKMRSQIKGLGQAQKNIEDGVSLVQTAEGTLNEVHSMLQRVRELAVQYKNGTLNQSSRDAIQTEVTALASEIDRIGTAASFNGIALLNNAGTITLQVGANDGETIGVATISLAGTLGASFASLSATGTADLSEIDAAITAISSARANFGAVQNRLDRALSQAAVYQENLIAAESRIRDVDMADEMAKLTKTQVLQQAGTAMLAQANQAPQSVLSLIKG